MTTALIGSAAGERLGFRVDGMDCASCVGKIETALGRLGGISDVSVNFTTETLTLARDASSKTTAKDIAKKIRSLGFDVTELPAGALPSEPLPRAAAHDQHGHHGGCSGDHHHDHQHDDHGGSGHAHSHDHGAHDDHGHGASCGGHHGHDHSHAQAGHDHGHDHGSCDGHDHAAPVAVRRAAPSAPPNVAMRVEGMDCASCVGKIETALARTPGVSDVRVNFTTETLELNLASGSSTQLRDIEKTIKSSRLRRVGRAPAL